MKTSTYAVCEVCYVGVYLMFLDIFGQNVSNLRTKFEHLGHFRTNSRTKFKIYILCIKPIGTQFVKGVFYKYVMETVFKTPFSDISRKTFIKKIKKRKITIGVFFGLGQILGQNVCVRFLVAFLDYL